MKQSFEGHTPATHFAQTESKKINRKLSVFLVRDGGLKYVVCDSPTSETIQGKLLGTYGEDFVPKPIQQPSPAPITETVKEPKLEIWESISLPVSETETLSVESSEVNPENTAEPNPKKPRKQKDNE